MNASSDPTEEPPAERESPDRQRASGSHREIFAPGVEPFTIVGFQDGRRVLVPAGVASDNPRHHHGWNFACLTLPMEPGDPPVDPAARTALHVALRVLCRGVHPPYPPVAEDQTSIGSPADGHQVRPAWKSPDGSEDEEVFFRDLAPYLLGPHARYLHCQVPVSFLAPSLSHLQGSRVDFAVIHPASPRRAIVIEIDGSQHLDDPDQVAIDEARDAALSNAGHLVFRIPSEEIRARGGSNLTRLAEALAPLHTDAPTQSRSQLAAAQTEIALVHAVLRGLLQPGASHWVVAVTGPLRSAMKTGLTNALHLLRALDDLYGAHVLPSQCTVCELSAAPATLDLVMWWSDADPWFAPLLHDTQARHAPHVAIRPIWLPVLPALPVPPASWTEPNPTVTSDSLRVLLARAFPPLEQFWPGQEEALRRCLHGQDSLVLLPTGGGKSLIYQLASLLMPGFCLVVAPLVSLMEDQVLNLRRFGIDRAVAISRRTGMAGLNREIQELLRAGVYTLCYISPERLQTQDFRDTLIAARISAPIPLVVVDEAHCVSEWGHDFRPPYLSVSRIARQLGRRGAERPPSLVGLTGTASRSVLRDVQRELSIVDIDAVITPDTFDRPELTFEAIPIHTRQKRGAMASVFRALPERLGRLGDDLFATSGDRTACGIVFCPHSGGEHGVFEIAAFLSHSLRCEVLPYAAKNMSLDDRALVARRFKDNEVPVLAATKAFGMGIDKPNVRYTVHYGLPPSLEAFYQEAGRAGRDRRHAHCVILASVDQPQVVERLLNPSLLAAELAREHREIPWSQSDDIVRSLYFHCQAYAGTGPDLANLEGALEQIGDLSIAESVCVEYGDDPALKSFEKALHRMMLLGLVDDYTIDYGNRRIVLQKVAATPTSVLESMRQYVAGYSRRRAERLLKDMGSLPESLDEAVARASETLVSFIYETVEASRRAAIREAWRWTQKGNDDATLRRLLLDYLQETEFSREVLRLVAESELDVGQWRGLLETVSSRRDREELAAALSRYSEDYPDQPSLLATQAIVTGMSQPGATEEVRDQVRAAVRFLRGRYSTAEGDLVEFVEWMLAEFYERAPTLLPTAVHAAMIGDDGTLALRLLRGSLPAAGRQGLIPSLLRSLRTATEDMNNALLTPIT